MVYGWSTLSFGSELWAWSKATWAEQVEGSFLRIILGVGQHTSYHAMCWFLGLSPAQDRLWVKAIKLLSRMGKHTDTLEASALQQQYDI